MFIGLCVCVCTCTCACMCAQLCPTLCDPMDCSLPGSSVHGLFQAKLLEWIAISYSRGFSRSRKIPDSGSNSHLLLWQAGSLPLVLPGRRAWQPTPGFLPRGSHGQRGLVGHSPWGPKESASSEGT